MMTRRFCRYIEKRFGFSELLGTLRDSRERPQIPTASAWLSAFCMFVTGRGSLNAIDGELRVAGMLERIVGPRKPSGDRLGEIFCLLDPEPLRAMLVQIVRRLKRSKALRNDLSMWFVAVDGHELFSLTTAQLSAVLDPAGERGRRAGHRVLPSGGGVSSHRLLAGGAA